MTVYLYLYADCLVRGVKGALKSPWTLALPVVYLAIQVAGAFLVAPLGIVGGFILGIIANLSISSFLYFVGAAVLGTPARFWELKKSFLEYFWPVMGVLFVLWVGDLMLGYALASNPQRTRIELGLGLILAVLLNAVPEVVYQKGHLSGLATIMESVKFIQNHWIEWFVPNGVLWLAVYAAWSALLLVPFGVVLLPLALGALVYLVMAFRGNLFRALDTMSAFQLRMRYHGGVGLGR